MINWQEKAERIKNIVRVNAKPFNPAQTVLLNKYIFINKVSIVRDEKYPAQRVGRMVDIWDGERIVVSCADGCLVLEEYEIVPALEEHEREVYLRIGNRFA